MIITKANKNQKQNALKEENLNYISKKYKMTYKRFNLGDQHFEHSALKVRSL